MYFFHLLSWAGLGHWVGAYSWGVGRDVSVGARSHRSASADRTEPGCTLGTVRNHCHHPALFHRNIRFIRIEDGTLPPKINLRRWCETFSTSSRRGSIQRNATWLLLVPTSQCQTWWKLATSIKEKAVSNCGLKFQMSRLLTIPAKSWNLQYSSEYPA